MNDKSHGAFLDRQTALLDVKTHFADRSLVHRELVDYGTHLLVRCIHGSSKTLVDTVVLNSLAKQAVEMLDGASVLLDNGVVYPAYLQIRSMFECGIYVRWILKSDPDKRARAYYVADLRKELQANQAVLEGTFENRTLKQDIGSLPWPKSLNDPKVLEAAKARIKEIKNHLKRKSLSAINAEFNKRKGNRRRDPPWFAPLVPKKENPTLRKLACEVERLPEYKMIYEPASVAMHGLSLAPHITIRDGIGEIRSIRDLSQFPIVSRFAIGESLGFFRSLLGYYRPQELDNFSRKYTESWRSVFLRQEKIVCPEPETTIQL